MKKLRLNDLVIAPLRVFAVAFEPVTLPFNSSTHFSFSDPAPSNDHRSGYRVFMSALHQHFTNINYFLISRIIHLIRVIRVILVIRIIRVIRV